MVAVTRASGRCPRLLLAAGVPLSHRFLERPACPERPASLRVRRAEILEVPLESRGGVGVRCNLALQVVTWLGSESQRAFDTEWASQVAHLPGGLAASAGERYGVVAQTPGAPIPLLEIVNFDTPLQLFDDTLLDACERDVSMRIAM